MPYLKFLCPQEFYIEWFFLYVCRFGDNLQTPSCPAPLSPPILKIDPKLNNLMIFNMILKSFRL